MRRYAPPKGEETMITDSFDDKSKVIIEPFINESAPEVDACIVTFSDKIELAVLQNHNCTQIGEFNCATRSTPVYLLEHNGRRFAFFKTMIGAPACVGTIEDSLAAIKTKKYIVFGGAGCLDKEIAHGKVMIPTAAYRDEGTSYHYAPAADYITVRNHQAVTRFMEISGIPFVKGLTWTTDAFYRETENNFKKRKADGCISVEMECAALQAMCDFRGLELYTFFTSGDLLDAPEWDKRHEDEELEGTQHDARHFDIALGLAEFISGLAMYKVLTMNNWWDGPLLGLCTFNGEHCVFERVFSEEKDDYTDDYYLTPVDEAVAREIILDYRRWCEFMKNCGNASDWKSTTDISNIAKSSPHYRRFTRYALFKGNFTSCSDEIKDYFVQWC